MMHRMVTTSTLVTSNDELVGYSEGLECLLLQGYYQANAGNLRKAWISFRRAMCLGQLMGIDRGQKRAFRSCNPQTPPQERPTAEFLWYRIINSDRYLSLLLGLQHGTDDNSFLYSVAHSRDTPMERLEKIHTYLSAKIIERNQAKGKRAYSLTQEICYELDEAAKTMGESWWEIPKMDPFDKPGEIYEYTAQMILQIHHSTMLVLLHLPYMLREPNESRYDFNKCTAMKACRDVLKRFIVFRSLNVSAFSCRRVDYAALIATMTLLLGYLRRRKAEPTGPLYEKRCREDRELVEKTRKRMEHIQNLNKDKLSGESCEIIKQMLPIIIKAGTEEVVSLEQGPAGWDDGVHLNVPFLGTINVSKADPAGASSSVDPRCIDIDPTALAFCSDISFSAPSLLASADGTMQPNAPVNNEGDLLAPDVAAEGYEWAFQGVDTAFWSLLNESVGLDG
ncbi:putative c6 zinc finger domain containing protein [Phaeoacremonium minimum UCRPA7]|uniref:Putative c6 zinc finger domain containing protein n=1 Tax=Phaeoacremonium minimum (strain UCR-PA7) TaxID=1286976 RepID=R8BJU0_PHAM7|nr:putative c6 zinc finger domain containing protein [Phaeoacremonium minimum UCRPA7]EON99482.1 putative c6 zinc finger domain containing protein [Phaeoacremonium minimum UCRPA7]